MYGYFYFSAVEFFQTYNSLPNPREINPVSEKSLVTAGIGVK
jgi:hypothetical protein